MKPGELEVLYEDNHILAVVKPAGLLVQGDRSGDETLLDLARAYLKEKYNKPGNVFLGLVHRIDRPASGTVVLARTSKAASRLARAFKDRSVDKLYLAVVEGVPPGGNQEISGYIERAHMRSRLVDEPTPRSREARLTYTVVADRSANALLRVSILTGRHHQIRLQLSAEGYPIVGDLKYGAREPLPDRSIALHAAVIEVPHPTRQERIAITAPAPGGHPWGAYRKEIEQLLR